MRKTRAKQLKIAYQRGFEAGRKHKDRPIKIDYGIPKGYQMNPCRSWKDFDYPAFIKIGWTDEALIRQEYLVKV